MLPGNLGAKPVSPMTAPPSRFGEAGLVKTHTRRWYLKDDQRCHCTCGAPRRSARHRFAECPEMAPLRDQLSARFHIPAPWWQAQPRVLSKSGWITSDAGDSHDVRVQRQIAACTLGIAAAKLGRLVAEDVLVSVHKPFFLRPELLLQPLLPLTLCGARLRAVHSHIGPFNESIGGLVLFFRQRILNPSPAAFPSSSLER